MNRLRSYALLFVFLTFVYHSNLRPIAAGDSIGASLIPFSVVLDHSITLDRFGPRLQDHRKYPWLTRSHGHFYSGYPIAGAVFVSPLYLPAALIPAVRRMPPDSLMMLARIVEKFTAVALTAAAVIWMLVLLLRLVPAGWAWVLTLVFALCTSMWATSSQALWQHTFGVVAIVGFLDFLARWEEHRAPRWAWCCGAAVGAAAMIRPSNAFLLIALAAALWLSRGRGADLVRFFVPALAGVLAVVSYNVWIFGTVRGGYPVSVLSGGGRSWGWAGVLISPGRGLLVFTPIVIFALGAFLPRARENRKRHMAVVTACACFVVCQIALIGKSSSWAGGTCWGPRLLTETVPALMVLVAVGTPAIRGAGRYAFAALALYCLFIQALGVYYFPKGYWDSMPLREARHSDRMWDWSDNPIRRTLNAGPAWEPYVIVETAWEKGLPAASQRLRAYGISAY